MTTIGKNFSCNNVAGKRRAADFYETPYSMTHQLLDVAGIGVNESVLEPACGGGAIVRVLSDRGYQNVTAYDLEDGKSFLDETGRFDCVLTNPPYSLSQEFIRHGLEVADRTIYLLPITYLHGQRRHDEFYGKGHLHQINVFTRYPLLGEALRDDGTYRTGMMAYGWFDFRRERAASTKVRWLDNNQYVVRQQTRAG